MNAKTIMSLILATTLVISFSMAIAGDDASHELPTSVIIQSGGGTPPIIKAKWETPDEDPIKEGTQVFSPMRYQGLKEVTYWAIVTDPNGFGNLDRTYVDVYHPVEYPGDGSFKYQIQLDELAYEQVYESGCPHIDDPVLGMIIAELTDAYNAGLVTFGEGYTLEEIIHELQQCSAKAYRGYEDLDYHQPCGMYLVEAYHYDKQNLISEPLINHFEYVCSVGIELDFDRLDFEEVMVSSWKSIEGDYVFDTPIGPACKYGMDCRAPTVRNIGNIPAKIAVEFDDMGLGMTGDEYNVYFDARLDLDDVIYLDPYERKILPGTLDLCNTDKISFSIHVTKGDTNEYSGTSIIEAEPAPPYYP